MPTTQETITIQQPLDKQPAPKQQNKPEPQQPENHYQNQPSQNQPALKLQQELQFPQEQQMVQPDLLRQAAKPQKITKKC